MARRRKTSGVHAFANGLECVLGFRCAPICRFALFINSRFNMENIATARLTENVFKTMLPTNPSHCHDVHVVFK